MIDQTDRVEVLLNQIERAAQVMRATRRATRRPCDPAEVSELLQLCHRLDIETVKEREKLT